MTQARWTQVSWTVEHANGTESNFCGIPSVQEAREFEQVIRAEARETYPGCTVTFEIN